MKRELKFRGKRKDNGEWIKGMLCYVFNNTNNLAIMPNNYFATREMGVDEEGDSIISETEMALGGFMSVITETVGQFTGLTDKNGNEIYDGDVLNLKFIEDYHNDCVSVDEGSNVLGNVKFESGGWYVSEKDSTWYFLFSILDICCIEVIGNIHDNPESIEIL